MRVRPLWLFTGSVLLLLVAIGLPLAGVLHTRAQWASETLGTIEPRHARLLGLLDRQADLAAAASAATAASADLLYPSDQTVERVATDLQQKLRSAASEAGFTVVGSQIQPVRNLAGLDEVSVVLTLEGALDHLAAFADALEGLRPQVRVSVLTMVPLRGRGVNAQRHLRAEMTLSSLKVMP